MMSRRVYGEDRSAHVLTFLAAVADLCREHKLCIGHEDGHGAFEVHPLNEGNISWLSDATEMATMQVTQITYPKLFEAFQLLDYDNGADPQEVYEVQASELECAQADAGLAELSKEDFEEFSIGEEDAARDILNRDPRLEHASEMLTFHFENLGAKDGTFPG